VNADELDAAWRSLHTPDSAHVLEAVPFVGNQVWAAVDYEGRRHLLLQVPEGTDAPPTKTRGLRVTVARHQVQDAEPTAYLDLACLSDDAIATFTAVAADIGAEAELAPPSHRLAVVAAALSRWQWFWGVEAGSLSEREALGLFGELWFLHRWAGDGPAAVDAWTASAGSRHDFQWPGHSSACGSCEINLHETRCHPWSIASRKTCAGIPAQGTNLRGNWDSADTVRPTGIATKCHTGCSVSTFTPSDQGFRG